MCAFAELDRYVRIKADPSGALKRSPGISVTMLAACGIAAEGTVERGPPGLWVVPSGAVPPGTGLSPWPDMMEKDGNGYWFEGNDATIEAARENMEWGGEEEKERVVRNERDIEIPSRKTKNLEILFA
jgi:hypothetical protein